MKKNIIRSTYLLTIIGVILVVSAIVGSASKGDGIVSDPISISSPIFVVYETNVTGNTGVGTYTIETGLSHPNASQNVFFDGAVGNPRTTYNTIRVNGSKKEYVQTTSNPTPSSGFTLDPLDNYITQYPNVVGNSIVTSWTTPESLNITQIIRIVGSTLNDSSVGVTTEIRNDNASAQEVGVRYEWDYEIDGNDDSWFRTRNPDSNYSNVFGAFTPPAFGYYQEINNLVTPAFSVFGSVSQPTFLSPPPTAPDSLMYVYWPNAYNAAFDYTPSGSGGDSAVLYYWKNRTIQSGQTIRLTAYVTTQETAIVVPANGSIPGTKFNDLNGNGIRDSGEPGLANWTINLRDSTGTIIATTKTASDGSYKFSNLSAGNYTVGEVLQAGWKQTAPTTGVYNVTIAGGSAITGKDFGNMLVPPSVNGSISGTKYNDLNSNGTRDAGEPGLANWTITLKNGTGATVAMTLTASDGTYTFSNLTADNYTVGEVLKAGWTQTAPKPVPPGTYTVALSAGQNATGLDFGNRIPPPPKLNISGRKFNDLNNNSVEDAGEPGLSGWQIDLNFTNGTVFRMTTTASDGSYKFENVDAGTYIVQEVQQTGWTQTFPTPVPPGTYTITLTNASMTSLDFGNFFKPSEGKPGKVVGWGNLGSKGSFKIWVYSHFLPSGTMEFTDTINKVTIEATRLDSVTTDIMATPKTGTITGMATVNGASPYAFTVKVVDAASPGAGKDMFTIDVSSPTPYHNSGTLTMGDITVVK